MTYLKPVTPLPWRNSRGHIFGSNGCDVARHPEDFDYLVHAANAFPHLVRALEKAWRDSRGLTKETWDALERALAIASGEVTP
jgi:hypothetical protein